MYADAYGGTIEDLGGGGPAEEDPVFARVGAALCLWLAVVAEAVPLRPLLYFMSEWLFRW